MYLSYQPFHSIRKLSSYFHKCCDADTPFLIVSVSIYDQNGTCLPRPIQPIIVWINREKEVKESLRVDTLYLKCLLIVLCSFHITFVLSSWFVQNSLTLYKVFKRQTTWYAVFLHFLLWGSREVLCWLLPNYLPNKLNSNTMNHSFYPCISRDNTNALFHPL